MKLIYEEVNEKIRYQVYGVLRVRLEEQVREQVNNNVRHLLWDQVFRRLSAQTITRMVCEQINENIIL